MMHIDAYHFGTITVNGKDYDDDIVITASAVFPNWWRREGHEVSLFDIIEHLDPKPKRLIIGTGAHGVCEVLQELEDYCKRERINLMAIPTPEAVVEFNSLAEEEQGKTITALHLSC